MSQAKTLAQAKKEIILKALEAFDKLDPDEFNKLIVEQAMSERVKILRKLLGLSESDTDFSQAAGQQGGRGTNNRNSALYGNINAEMTALYEKHIVPELTKMIAAEKEQIVSLIKQEFVDSGYLMHKARTLVLEQSDDWIAETVKDIVKDFKETILKEQENEYMHEGNFKPKS